MRGELVICPKCGNKWRRKHNHSISYVPYKGSLCSNCRYNKESRDGF